MPTHQSTQIFTHRLRQEDDPQNKQKTNRLCQKQALDRLNRQKNVNGVRIINVNYRSESQLVVFSWLLSRRRPDVSGLVHSEYKR